MDATGQQRRVGLYFFTATYVVVRLAMVAIMGWIASFVLFFILWAGTSFTFASAASYYLGCAVVSLIMTVIVMYESAVPGAAHPRRGFLLAPVFLVLAISLAAVAIIKGNSATTAKEAEEAEEAAKAERLENRTPEEKFASRCFGEGQVAVWTDRPVSEACQGTQAARNGAARELEKEMMFR